jgi:glycerophosphoryl diester phosphodiesterase
MYLLSTLLSIWLMAHPSARPPRFVTNGVVAHRGAFLKNNYPENSIASLKEAIKLGCTGSEFDVRMTADSVLVINHDPHYHQLPIEQSTYPQLSRFPLSNGEKLPTLKAYLEAGKNKKTKLVLEIKPSETSSAHGQLIVEKVWQEVKALKMQAWVTYISFDYQMLLKIKSLDATAPTQYLNGDKSPAELKKEGIDGADYHFSVFKKNPEWVTSAKQLGVQLNVWTVNQEENLRYFLDQKFDFITTNEPELLFSIINEKKK